MEVKGEPLLPLEEPLCLCKELQIYFACGYQGTIPEPYVAFAGDCEMEKEEQKDQHEGMMNILPYLFQNFFAQRKETALRKGERDKSVHSYMHSISDLDVSLYGGIPPRRPPDIEMMRGII